MEAETAKKLEQQRIAEDTRMKTMRQKMRNRMSVDKSMHVTLKMIDQAKETLNNDMQSQSDSLKAKLAARKKKRGDTSMNSSMQSTNTTT